MYIPQDSPLVLHLLTSWRPARSRSLPHMHVQRWTWLGFERAIARTEDECATIVPATQLLKIVTQTPLGFETYYAI